MIPRTLLAACLTVATGLLGCSAPPPQDHSPALYHQITGRLDNGVYVSPYGDFRVTVPPLLQPGAKIADGIYGPGRFSVEFSDGQCRVYAVARREDGATNESLDVWFDRALAPHLKNRGIIIRERENIRTESGPAVLILAKHPHGAPCVVVEPKSTGYVETKGDVELGMFVLRKGPYLYQIMYEVGEGVPGFIPIRPVKELLRKFFEGFAFLGPEHQKTGLKKTQSKRLKAQRIEFLVAKCVERGNSERLCRCVLNFQQETLGTKFIEAQYLQVVGDLQGYEKQLFELGAENARLWTEQEKIDALAKERCAPEE
ncbi:MAG: hypothetical protein D6694_10950 [Gammaproteobacteria bacterium]|nr:MAG: hypothetical protein D6694_10950 [Gammaproteobacteria bacterium]